MRGILSRLITHRTIGATRKHITSTMANNIQSFVFLDSETTGLPHMEYNRTRLTELCLTVVQSDHISMGVYPRVQNTISFCFNPCKMIDHKASELTGLWNDLLEYQSTFKPETVTLINNFLELQRKPICFVAHNGNYFDYPIFRAEIDRTGVDLPDDILCIDSLQAFRELFKRNNENIEIQNLPPIPPQKQVPVELCDGFDDLLCKSVEEFENDAKGINPHQIINETTPKKSTAVFKSNTTSNIDQLYYMPSRAQSSSAAQGDITNPIKTGTNARKQLRFGTKSFKLVDVYESLTNKAAGDCHRAEQDVSMLIECAATLGQEFVDWANSNAKFFRDIPMMKPGRKIGT